MKQNISYVFPNISIFNRNGRGGLHQRYEFASAENCKFIEVPADFIKNKTEVQITGRSLGTILTKKEVKKLYESGTPSKKIKYILHTEPSLSRRDGTGTSKTPSLRWNDQKWVNDFIEMILAISGRFRIPPAGIEIHPGGRSNTYEDIIKGITAIRSHFERTFKTIPFVVIENRTGQFISNGNQISEFWKTLLSYDKSMTKDVGIVLDIQQLFTVTKEMFLNELNAIPQEAIKGFHIHHKHRTPSLENNIPWTEVFGWLRNIKGEIFINPEVHHHSQAKDTISFCQRMIG